MRSPEVARAQEPGHSGVSVMLLPILGVPEPSCTPAPATLTSPAESAVCKHLGE